MTRALSDGRLFLYDRIFSYFNKDPNARRIVGCMANSITTSNINVPTARAAGWPLQHLHVSRAWQKHGDFTSAQYLAAAERAFAHLQVYNTKYDDDGKENIIDDYCALMAATELWIRNQQNGL